MVATSGPGWQLAPCLDVLFAEADRRWPDRSDASDGTIGNAEHASRQSDHNPDGSGDVLAGDVTDDKANGCDADLLAHHLVASKDSRVAYVIWNDTVVRSYDKPDLPAWTPEEYRGTNPHITHTHISVLDAVKAKNDTRPWWPEEEPLKLDSDDLAYIRAIVRDELGLVDGDTNLYAKLRAKMTALRDSLATLIRG